jgi:hypothetical protein
MSRLIFEGDTTERFGRLFPKPFIEEIRVFDNYIDADIALYFEIEEDKTVTDFLSETGLDSLLIYTGVTTEVQLNGEGLITQLVGLSGGLSQFIESLQFKLSSLEAIGEQNIFNELQVLSSAQTSFFYNTNGKKFVKFLITDSTNKNYDFDGDGFGADVAEILLARYLICLTFYPDSNFSEVIGYDSTSMSSTEQAFVDRLMENKNLFSNQFSDVSYEKVLNSDQSLSTERQIVYIQSDGNYYTKTPLLSIDRIYRKTDLINHNQVISRIQTIINPFVGQIEEADLISLNLQQNVNSPRLLLAIQRNINNFSNKSTVTTTGGLYADLVDAVVDINNTLIGSEKVEKRLEAGSKIKDFRQLKLISTEQLKIPISMRRLNVDSLGRNFLSLPFLTRQVLPLVQAAGMSSGRDLDDFIIENTGYVTFDYEKALNYKSNISEFFNPYNILHIFGQNCLNKYFYIREVVIKKMTGTDLNTNAIELKTDSDPQFSEDLVRRNMQIQINAQGNFLSKTFYPQNSEAVRIESRLAERAAGALRGRNNYRLRVFEFTNLESVEQAVDAGKYIIEISIVDRTMAFFLEHFHDKMFDLLEELKQYLFFAEQFCSYNNIDGRFNDFFSTAMGNQFSEPFVWEEAPKFYYALFSIINMSWHDGDVRSTRKKDGSLSSLEQLSNLAIVTNRQINPTSGNLNDLRIFVQNFEQFYNDYIGYGSAWSDQIYVANGTSDQDISLSPDVLTQTNKTLTTQSSIVTEIIDSYDLEQYATTDVEAESSTVINEPFTREATQADRLSISDVPKQDSSFSGYADFFDYLSSNLGVHFYTKSRDSVADSENPQVRIGELNSSLNYENEFTQNLALYLDENLTTSQAWSSLIDFLGDGNQVSRDTMLEAIDDRTEVAKFVKFMRILVPLYEYENERFRLSNIGQLVESVKIWGEFE